MKSNRMMWNLRMLLCAVLLFCSAGMAWAENTNFDDANNFMAFSKGNGVYHFKILMWANEKLSGSNNPRVHFLGREDGFCSFDGRYSSWIDPDDVWDLSSVYLKVDGRIPYILYFYTSYEEGCKDKSDNNLTWATVHVRGGDAGTGKVVITNQRSEGKLMLDAGNTKWHTIQIKRSTSGDELAYLEFDWYMDPSLAGKKVEGLVYMRDCRTVWGGGLDTDYGPTAVIGTDKYWRRSYALGDFSIDAPQAPQLMTPVFYPKDAENNNMVGYAAIPYVCYQKPEQVDLYGDGYYMYYTLISDYGGTLEMRAEDDHPQKISAEFTTYFTDKDGVTMTQVLKAGEIQEVKPYHALYAFDVAKNKEGNVKLTWIIYGSIYPDLVEGDMVLVERAMQEDYSDAQVIGRVEMKCSERKDSTYTFIDSFPDIKQMYANNTPIYYRISRASAAVWNWDGKVFSKRYANKKRFDYTREHLYPSSATVARAKDYDETHAVRIEGSFFKSSSMEYWDPKSKFTILRKQRETGLVTEIPVPMDSIDIKNKCFRFTDHPSHPCVHYSYSWRVDISQAKFLNNTTTLVYTGDITPSNSRDSFYTSVPPKLGNLTASDGLYKKYVRLTTNTGLGDFDTLYVQYRYKGNWITHPNTISNGYLDDSLPIPGTAYAYRLKGVYYCNGNREEIIGTEEAVGSICPYGSVKGYVLTKEGAGISNLQILVEDTVTKKRYFGTTDANGYCFIDSIPYEEGRDFQVSVSAIAEYVTAQKDKSVTVHLDKKSPEQKFATFYPAKSYRVTGRVLYEKTSVPVPYCSFYITTTADTMGYILRRGDETIQTNLNGEFSFTVPEDVRSLRVVKQNHTFLGNGYYLRENKEKWTLADDVRDIRFWDTTKAHLVGRVVGGKKQGDKPIGKYNNTNNLGDSITIMLELEGDNISYLIRDPEDLSILSKTEDFAHPMQGHHSQVVTSRKNVVIYPDSATGEFHIDLLPCRFKVVQMSAQGYATLLLAGQAQPVWDMTDAIVTPDTINYVYHSDAQIQYRQMLYGQSSDFYGTKSFKTAGVTGKVNTVNTYDVMAKGNPYTFGYPVFSGENILFNVSTFEEYRYNNSPTATRIEQVPLAGTLRIYNGLCSETDTRQITIGETGETQVYLAANNTTFSLSDSTALRTLNMSFEYNGRVVQAQPLKAYVIGNTEIGGGIMQKLASTITFLDVIRDPYGANSYAWIEKGSQYSTTFKNSYQVSLGVDLGFQFGTYGTITTGVVAAPMGAGGYVGTQTMFSTGISVDFPIIFTKHSKDSYTYTYQLNERLQTSASPLKVGAAADVYLGSSTDIGYYRRLAIQIIDSVSYVAIAPSIHSGTAHLLAEGVADGKHYYLVEQEAIAMGQTLNSTFAYTQDHILNVILPELYAQRNILLMQGDRATLQEVADKKGTYAYQSKLPADDPNFGKEGQYNLISPSKVTKTLTNDVQNYNSLIAQWEKAIEQNERTKIEARGAGKPAATYAISDGTTRTNSETCTSSQSATSYWTYPIVDQGVKVGASVGGSAKEDNGAGTDIEVKTPGVSFSFNLSPAVGYSGDKDNDSTRTISRTTGYCIAPGTDSYTNQSVYKVTNDVWESATKATRNKAYDISSKYQDNYISNDYVFFQNGGATSCPYEPADSAVFVIGEVVSNSTQRINVPRLTLDVHEREDIPCDEAANFTLLLSNETELEAGVLTDLPSEFLLQQVDESNPSGAQIFVDGTPLGAGRTFVLTPGQHITKLIQVKRGLGYDVNNLQLQLKSACDVNNYDRATLSVHYARSSSPVRISMPDQQWVMNTYSPKDEDGYYIPVEITDFDLTYDNFDHIEFQYKLSTEGESRWVNLCSYYANDSLYQLATGNKKMIPSGGTIHGIRFHGERDPMEQKYDLRAVTYCRYGNGFISRASQVVSGTKDTSIPKTFGIPTPTNGILTFEDVIKVPFSEEIAGGFLDRDNNFQVLGTTTSTNIALSTSLAFAGRDTSMAISEFPRALGASGFTIEMMVHPTSLKTNQVFFSHIVDNTTPLVFGLAHNKDKKPVLAARIKDQIYYSAPLESGLEQLTLVAFTYNATDSTISFYEGEKLMNDANTNYKVQVPYMGNGYLSFGGSAESTDAWKVNAYSGRILEARVWSTDIGLARLKTYHGKHLTGYERSLLAYYPLNDGKGLLAKDKAHGDHLILRGTSWQIPQGLSLRLNPKNEKDMGVALDNQLVANNGITDFSLFLWWRADRTQLGDTVTLMASGSGQSRSQGIFIGLESGHITLHSGGKTWQSASSYLDNNWHHLCLVVNRTRNTALTYVDEELTFEGAAADVGAISNTLYIGSCNWMVLDTVKGQQYIRQNHYPLTGFVDQFAFFDAAVQPEFVAQYAQAAPSGEELALRAYAPFHAQHLTINGEYEMVYSPLSEKVKRDDYGTILRDAKKDTLVRSLGFAVPAKDYYAPIKGPTPQNNIEFEFLARDNELQVNLLTPAASINKQQIYLTLRGIEDKQGNPIASPITIPIYVDLNRLRWKENSLEITLPYHQDSTFSTTIVNRCGSIKQYSISTDVDWLTTRNEMGQLSPKGEQKVTFSIADGLNPGTYSTIVYLTDEASLSEPLLLTINIQPVEPDWEVNTSDLSSTMNVVATVMVPSQNGVGLVYDTDEKDIVGAFIASNNRCVGLAHPSVDNATGKSMVYMTVHGNEGLETSNIQFYLWDATTGEISQLYEEENLHLCYNSNKCLGCDRPLDLRTMETSHIQLITLNPGWNWISSYLAFPEGKNGLSNVIRTAEAFSVNDEIKTSRDSGRVARYEDLQHWTGSLATFMDHEVYMAKSTHGGKIQLVGNPIPDEQRSVRVGTNNWMQLPYLCTTTLPIESALAGYYDYAKVGDIVKSYTEFAVFTSDRHWEGSLNYMRPGEGYYIYSHQVKLKEFFYPSVATEKSNNPAPKRIAEENTTHVAAMGSTNMPVIATLTGEPWFATDVLRAWVGNTCVGGATAQDNRFFMLLYAADSKPVRFTLERNGELVAEGTTQVLYDTKGYLGSYEEPYPIELRKAAPAEQTEEEELGIYKVVRDGQLYIIRNGEWYNAVGGIVK